MNSLIKKEEIIDNRNYGIDLLRIISMFFVVTLHSLGHGGMLKSVIIDSIQYKFIWFLEILAYCAVDIFALISGYVSYNNKEKKVNYSNYINLWLQVVFYGILINLILNIINPSWVNATDFLATIFPVTKKLYWYFTAYTGLFVIIPIINKGIKETSDSNLKKLFIAIFLVFSFLEVLSPKFILNGGYSFIWITLLYILGAIIKKTDLGKNLKKHQIIMGIIFLCIITYISKIYGVKISKFGILLTKDTYVSYISPTILGMAILYVIFFSKIKFNKLFTRVIKFAAPSTFAIYLLNDHYLVRKNLISNLFVEIANSSLIKIFITVISFSLLFVIGSILIDRVRIALFKKCKVKEISQKIINILNNILDNLVKILE